MPILRELISRFSFETDKKSVKGFHTTIGSMKKSALALGAVLGISLGGKALFGMGVSAKQAEEDLKRLAGTDLENINNHLFIMKQRLDNVQAGASNLLRTKTVNVLASQFIKDFGSANKEIETFTQLLETATLQSAITGTSVEEIFTGLTNAIKTGDFSALVGIGGFDLRRQKLTEEIVAAKDPREIGGQVGRDIRTEALLSITENAFQEQRRQLFALDRTLVDLGIATQVVKKGTEDIAETAAVAATKAGAAVFKATKEGTEILDIGKKGKPVTENIGGQLLDLFRTSVQQMKERRGIAPAPVEVNMPSTINVYEATDAEGVVKLIKKEDEKRIGEARRQIIRSEERK